MSATFNVTGTQFLYWRFRGDTIPTYIGTCETGLAIDGDPHYLDVINDLKSRTVPMVRLYDGSRESVTCTINRLDFAVWSRIKAAQDHNTFAYTPGGTAGQGFDRRGALGNITTGIGDGELFFVNSFFGTAQATPTLGPGRWYFSAVVGAFHEESVGNRVNSVAVRFDCDSIYDPTTGGFPLYTDNILGISFPTPT